MNNLILSLNVVLPLFINMAVGYFLKCIKMYDDQILNRINKLCFKVFLPCYLFRSIYITDLEEVFDGRLIILAVLGILIWFGILMLLIPRLEKENPRRGVMVQAMFRSNFVLFGLPVAASICGEENVGITSLLIAFVVPTFNVLAVITLEAFRGGKPSPKKMIKGIITNPLIIASVLGVLAYFSRITLPQAVDKSLSDLAKVATPLSLVVLGGSFSFGKIRNYVKQIVIGVTGKLVIAPLVMIPLAIAMGFKGPSLVAILTAFASPCAVNSFTMAQQMDGDADLAAQYVVFTTGLSIITMFLWVFVLKQGSFI